MPGGQKQSAGLQDRRRTAANDPFGDAAIVADQFGNDGLRGRVLRARGSVAYPNVDGPPGLVSGRCQHEARTVSGEHASCALTDPRKAPLLVPNNLFAGPTLRPSTIAESHRRFDLA